MRFRLTVPDRDGGIRLPWGFGFAYRDVLSRTTVFYRWPLNHAVAQWRRFWWWARDARRLEDDAIGPLLVEARREARSCGFDEGYRDGHRDGHAAGKSDALKIVESFFGARRNA